MTTTNPMAGVTGPLVTTLEAVWAEIRERHPDVPPVVLTLASGTMGEPPGRVNLGHFAGARWEHVERGELAELFIAGEGLALGALDVLGTLLHEAGHGLAHTRQIQDTSRQGRYHNARFKALAVEMGLTVDRVNPIGWSDTTVPDSTAAAYSAQLDQLTAAIRAHRRDEHTARTLAAAGPGGSAGAGHGSDGRTSNNNGVAARCSCSPPRRIRVALSVLEIAPITCGACAEPFSAAEDGT